MLPQHCSRCDAVGHSSAACPLFPHPREAHADAQPGDNVPHINETEIVITVDDLVAERNQLHPGWWEGRRIEIAVNGTHFILGRASGEDCNCLIYTLQQVLPTRMFNVSFVRAELERRHAGRPTAIVRRDYLDLASYWADIIDIIGQYNEQGIILD